MADNRSRRQKLWDLASHPRTPKAEAAAARRALDAEDAKTGGPPPPRPRARPRVDNPTEQARWSAAAGFESDGVGRQAYGGTPSWDDGRIFTGADIRRASEDLSRARRPLLCHCRHSQEAHWRTGVIRGAYAMGICSVCGCTEYRP